MRRTVLLKTTALFVALVLASSASAGEILKLRNGTFVPGDVVAMDDEGVLFAREQGGEARIAWTEILPISRYELRAAHLAADDAPGRLALAEWALGEQLFHQARKEALKAKGAGETHEAAADSLLATIAKSEADAALADIDARIDDGDVAAALDRARAYLRIAPPGEHADRVRSRVPDLLVRIERVEADAAEAAEDAALSAASGRKQEWIEKHLAQALETKLEAQETSIEAYANLAKGNQTRARKALISSEKDFLSARALLKRVRRAAGPGEVAEQCQRESKDIDRRMLDLLTRWGEMDVGNRSWSRANEVVDRGLKIDPVDPALLDLRRRIDEGWIRRRASDITNARGRESSR